MVIFSNAQPVPMPAKLAERALFVGKVFEERLVRGKTLQCIDESRKIQSLEKSKSCRRFQQSRSFCASTKEAFAVNMSLINVNGPVDSPVKNAAKVGEEGLRFTPKVCI